MLAELRARQAAQIAPAGPVTENPNIDEGQNAQSGQ
jgi:hypothetical protein